MNYYHFQCIARFYSNKAISRKDFINGWKNTQNMLGIKPKVLNKSGTQWGDAT